MNNKQKRKNVQLLASVHAELVAVGLDFVGTAPTTMSPPEIIKALIDEHNERRTA